MDFGKYDFCKAGKQIVVEKVASLAVGLDRLEEQPVDTALSQPEETLTRKRNQAVLDTDDRSGDELDCKYFSHVDASTRPCFNGTLFFPYFTDTVSVLYIFFLSVVLTLSIIHLSLYIRTYIHTHTHVYEYTHLHRIPRTFLDDYACQTLHLPGRHW
jgi:hypothetical protein